MRMRRVTLALLAFFVSAIALYSQSVERYLLEAEEAYANKNYYAAYQYMASYMDLKSKDEDPNIDLEFFAAEAARRYKAFALAEMHYDKVVEMERNNEFPLASFWSAEMKMRQGNYEQALQTFNRYLTEQEGENPYYTKLANNRVESCNWALENRVDSADESVFTLTHLGDGINTEYSEVSPYIIQDNLYFSSLRFDNPKDKHNPKRPLSKILYSEDYVQGLLYENLDGEDDALHIGNMIYDEETNLIYYTKCWYLEGEEIRCNLYAREFGETLGEEMPLTALNSDSTTVTQPSIGLTPRGDQKALYYVSDQPGGMGKNDIWYVTIDGAEILGEPVNLMKINTLEDEYTPFYHAKSKSLFFSSQGYKGFGGYDVYRVNFDQFGKAEEPFNLGAPLNSSYDDIYYVVNDYEDDAYFSSNRLSSFYLDTAAEACCFDIYNVKINPVVDLLALTYDLKTRDDLAGCTVQLLDAQGEVIGTLTNLDSNNFEFEILRNQEYTLIANRNGYHGDTVDFSTAGIPYGETLVQELFLEKADIYLDLCVFDDETKEPILGSLVTIIDQNTGDTVFHDILTERNCHKTKVLPGHDYEVTVHKDGYRDDVRVIKVPEDAYEDIKQDVYLKKWTLEDLLPLVVFFDNDIPDPRSRDKESMTTYTDTYHEYVSKKSQYMDENAKPYPEYQKWLSKELVQRFFDEEVIPAKKMFDQVKHLLLHELDNGKKISIEVSGYASPRASTGYNYNLSSRRTQSIVNDLDDYKEGALIPYIDSGKLIIKIAYYGEGKASDIAKETEFKEIPSIYSVAASRERRAEIKLIDIQ